MPAFRRTFQIGSTLHPIEPPPQAKASLDYVMRVKFRYFPLGGKSNHCAPPLLWTDAQTSMYLEEVGRKTLSPALLQAEHARLTQAHMRCDVGRRSYATLLQHARDKPDVQQRLFDAMTSARIQPNIDHYNSLLSGASNAKDLKRALGIMRQIKESGLPVTPSTLRALLYATHRCGKHKMTDAIVAAVQNNPAQQHFLRSELFLGAVVATCSSVAAAERYLQVMRDCGITPTPRHIESMLAACIVEADQTKAKRIISEVGLNARNGSKLLNIYTKISSSQCEEDAHALITLLQKKEMDAIFYAQAIIVCREFTAYRADRWVAKAVQLFEEFLSHATRWREPHIESVVEEMIKLCVKYSNRPLLHEIRKFLQHEGYHIFTPRILKIHNSLRTSETEKRTQPSFDLPGGLPDLAVRNSFSLPYLDTTADPHATPPAPQW